MNPRQRLSKLMFDATELGIARLLKDLLAEPELAILHDDENEFEHVVASMQKQIEWFAQHDCAMRRVQ
jgi:hypothetical protein